MAEFRGIQTSLLLILMLQFTEAATRQRLTVRDGDEVTLPCNSVTEDQNNCDSTVWFFTYLRSTQAVVLVTNGQIEEAKAESDRLSVSQNCSLVMKKVTRGDVGLYLCRQVRPGGQYKDAEVLLSVVSMTEETNRDKVTLRCSVWTNERCEHTVKWMNGGQDVDKDKEVKTSPSLCSASLSFMTSHFFYTSSFTSLTCEVTDGDKVMQFSPSGDKTGGWRLVSVSVGLAALIIILVVVNMWIRIKERKTQTEENAVRYDAEDDTVNYENMRPAAGV
uniref:uncharacterized protein LOC120808279 isoform X5 n=1 Tax=Gasterosteus aculeatus aculeatus TaxID=481459 RepID=UPI001A99060C|nr:uncharacterized protein LOC120808279 isoform X5 [Gasterosteus aculeatus aculeatus]